MFVLKHPSNLLFICANDCGKNALFFICDEQIINEFLVAWSIAKPSTMKNIFKVFLWKLVLELVVYAYDYFFPFIIFHTGATKKALKIEQQSMTAIYDSPSTNVNKTGNINDSF